MKEITLKLETNEQCKDAHRMLGGIIQEHEMSKPFDGKMVIGNEEDYGRMWLKYRSEEQSELITICLPYTAPGESRERKLIDEIIQRFNNG